MAEKVTKPYKFVVTVGIFDRYFQVKVMAAKKLGLGFFRSLKSKKVKKWWKMRIETLFSPDPP